MKAKLSLIICVLLAIFLAAGCKNKSSSQQPQEPNTPQQTSDKQSTTEPKSAIDDAAVEQDAGDQTEYFALFINGNKVGHATETRIVKDDQVKTIAELTLTVSRVGVSITVETSSTTVETIDGKPLGFVVEQKSLLGSTKTSGTLDKNGKLIVITGTQRQEMDWPEGALMSEGMRLLNIKYGLKEGTTYKAKVFEPSTLEVFNVDVNVGAKQQVDLLGRVVELTEIKSTASSKSISSLNTDEYYDDQMRLQKSITPVMGLNVEQVACSKEFAMGKNDVYEIVDKMFLASPEPIDNISSVKSITYHITRTVADANLAFPSTDSQEVIKLSNSNVILRITPLTAPEGIQIPYKGSDPAALEALKPSRYVESNEKIIKDLAEQAVGSTTDAAEAARKIESFVANYITSKDLSVGYASAAEVAVSRQGDCTEHAVLAAALCRAAGIPARVVSGVAYVSQWHTLSNGFGGHAWTQVYIGDKWYNIDAAFKSAGFGGYDAGHIALSIGNGNPEDLLNIVNTLGQFKINKIEVRN